MSSSVHAAHVIITVQFTFPFPFLCLQVQSEYKDSGLLYLSDQLQFEEGDQLGEGAFGVVRKALLQVSDTETVTVAVKALKGESFFEGDIYLYYTS